MRKIAVIPVALATILLASCGKTFSAAGVVVEGERIGVGVIEAEVEARLATQAGVGDPTVRAQVARNVVEEFIRRIVIRKEAARLGVTATKQEVDQTLSDLRQSFGQAQLDATVRDQGWTQREFLEQVRDLTLNNELYEKLAPVSVSEARREYNANREQFRQARFSDILITTQRHPVPEARRMINAAKARIDAGEDFGAVARDVSEDESTRENEGEQRGFVLLSGLDAQDPGVGGAGPGLGSAVARAPLNRVFGPVQTATGFHLLLVTARRLQPFGEVRERILTTLRQNKGTEEVNRLLQQAIQKVDVSVNPRYGRWNEETGRVEPKEFFKPPTTDANEPPGDGVFSPPPIAPVPGGG